MEFNTLRDNLKGNYSRQNWKDCLQSIFGQQINIDTNADKLIVQKGSAKSVERFASIELSDGKNIAVLDIKTVKSAQIARNRVALRDIVFKLIDQAKYHGLLVFYYSEDKEQLDYRLSFISSQSTFDDEGSLITQSTHPKRYSFLLGQNESCYTATQRLLELKNKVQPFKAFELQKGISLKDITDAFSVEALNKEFFKQYKDVHYKRFWEFIANEPAYAKLLLNEKEIDLAKKQKSIRDWVKKMLGRIVFLHFLQKKGWMACPADREEWKNGDASFMFNLFGNCKDKEAFYSQILTTLFFKTLNTKRDGDLIPKVLIKKVAFDNPNIRLPYLNGGLFENVLPETNKIDFPSEHFADLFEFFEQYNFTIDENSPDEQEVGIDPEMLGHIFENLLEENKDKGAFYTPKEIVHYMCQESLIEYLRTHLPECKEDDAPATKALGDFIRNDKIGDRHNKKDFIVANAEKIEALLDNVKICDPAIGSGAFPMGMLQEIFKAKTSLDLTLDKADVKKRITQNSIYGVDLESGAADIARLRFWLSLVVDEEVPQPLPNLDYKIMQGNSLLERFEGVDLSMMGVEQNDLKIIEPERDLFGNIKESQMKKTFAKSGLTKKVQKLIKKYFDIENADEKAKTKTKINKAIIEHIEHNIELRENQLHRWINETTKPEELKKAGKKKYDTWKTDLDKLQQTKFQLIEIEQSNEHPYFLWHLFFADVFEQGGFDIVIGNPPYIQLQKMGDAATKLQNSHYETFVKTGDIYCLFYEQGVNVLKDEGVITYITSNKWMRTNYGKKLRRYFTKLNPLLVVDLGANVFQSAAVDTNILILVKTNNQTNLKGVSIQNHIDLTDSIIENALPIDIEEDNIWNVLSKQDYFLKAIIDKKGKPLNKWNLQINRGILSGLTEAYLLTEVDAKKLISLDSKNKKVVAPTLRGKDLDKYRIKFKNYYLLNIHNGVRENSKPRIEIDEFPTIKKYLDSFGSKLVNRSDQGDTPYNLRNCAFLEEFYKEKIIFQEIVQKPSFAFDKLGEYFCLDTARIITGEKLKFLLTILNSNLFFYSIKNFYGGGGLGNTGIRMKHTFIDKFPVPEIHDTFRYDNIAEYLTLLHNEKSLTVNQYTENTSIASVFEDVANMMVYEMYFTDHMKELDIDVLQFIDTEKHFKSIDGLEPEKQAKIIGDCYNWLQKEDNEIRNRIIFSNIKSKDIIGRINSTTH